MAVELGVGDGAELLEGSLWSGVVDCGIRVCFGDTVLGG